MDENTGIADNKLSKMKKFYRKIIYKNKKKLKKLSIYKNKNTKKRYYKNYDIIYYHFELKFGGYFLKLFINL